MERGLRRPSAEVLQQLAKGLRISAEALYVRAGILEDGPRGTVEFAVESDEGLTSRQKKVLLELCAHFRSENARAEEDATARAAAAAAAADAAPRDEATSAPVTTPAPTPASTPAPVTASAQDARGTEKES